MIGLRNKVVQQQKEKEEAAAAAAPSHEAPNGTEIEMKDASSAPAAPSQTPAAGRGAGRGSISILGVSKKDGAVKGSGGRRLRPGEIRVQKDVSELDGGDCATPHFPNLNDLMNFEVVLNPDKGFWAGYVYTFSFAIPDMYPHEPPKVRCLDKIYHPNIDLNGNVCLNILRADWKPVLDLNAVIYGLIVLFESPNPDDPLNHDAAKCLRENPAKFKQNVDRSLRGMDVDGIPFPAARKGDRKS
jgi:ubiquitin-conjugating enzyme E2 M